MPASVPVPATMPASVPALGTVATHRNTGPAPVLGCLLGHEVEQPRALAPKTMAPLPCESKLPEELKPQALHPAPVDAHDPGHGIVEDLG